MAAAGASAPTRVLVLSNMVTREELADPSEYEDISADVRSEVSKFGELVRMIMPRVGEPGEGKVRLALGRSQARA